jgi:soluble lytic murein transglycosylase-like protein
MYQQQDFPRTEDIIAIVGIESSFRPTVKSSLKTDPAVGLMQVRPGVWKVSHKELSTIDGQIKHGANILAQYYDKIGKVEGAVMAYNVGITAYRKGKTNKKYLNKYKTEVAMYE